MKVYSSLVLLLLINSITNAYAAGIDLANAERLALDKDPLIQQFKAKSDSFADEAVAAKSWPDPKINLGLMNVNAKTRDPAQEAMTQQVLGITQAFPPIGATYAKHQQFKAMTESMNYAVSNQKLLTLKAVRAAWLDVYLIAGSLQLVTESLGLFQQMIQITEFQYRAGRGKQADILRAQLEQSLLRDKEAELIAQLEAAMAGLRKWTGRYLEVKDLDLDFPDLALPLKRARIKGRLELHPATQLRKSQVSAAENGVDFARANGRISWALQLQYGQREDLPPMQRDDLATAMMIFTVPVFTGNRHDRWVSARQSEVIEKKQVLDDWRRNLEQQLDANYAVYERNTQRVQLFNKEILPQAQQNAKATINAYQSGVSDFSSMIRARLMEFNSKLQFLKVKVAKAKAQIELLYLAGVDRHER